MVGDWGINAVTVWDVGPGGGGEWRNVAQPADTFSVGDFTPDGAGVVVATGDGGVSVADIATGRTRPIVPRRSEEIVRRMALSPDGRLLATTANDGEPVTIWDVTTGQLVARVQNATTDVADLVWSGDSRRLATTYFGADGGPGVVLVVDRAGKELGRQEQDPETYSPSVSLSPDGSLVAITHRSFGDDPAVAVFVTIWDWQHDRIVHTIRSDADVRVVSFDPTGRRIAVGGVLQGFAAIYDVATGERVAALAEPPSITDMAFSPDGHLLATGHADGTTRLWDVTSGVQQLILTADDNGISRVTFSPDGARLLTVSRSDGLVRVWALDLDQLIGIAHDRLTRGLTDDECRQYLHTSACGA
jgi:WD40 repeat protein